ncbi:MAG: hypothetical protein K2H34_03195 [Lachnospiraceae bacterium]|nr:hypothetical protein [Lachnospiraceae bacterium]
MSRKSAGKNKKNQKHKNNNEDTRQSFFVYENEQSSTENSQEETDEGEYGTDTALVRERLTRLGIGIIAVMVIVAAVLLGFSFLFGSGYNDYEVVEETGVKNASMVDYVPYQNALLKFSKDGATYVNEKGEAVWNETFAMKMPSADVSGEYVAIADLNGNDVYIFNKEGKVSSSAMPYQICDIAVASQGEFAVILEGRRANYINIYDKNGQQIIENQTTLEQSGYPMDIDLSEDGEKLFSAYLSIDGAKTKYSLAAYNFGPVGQNENADGLMGGYQLENTVIPKVEFLDNNTVCAFGDNQIIIYSMKEKPSEKAVIAFEEEIRSIIYNSDYIGVVVPGDKEDVPYILELYNTSGHKVMSLKIDFDYNKVRLRNDEIVFTGGTECRIYTIKGKLKFSYSFKKNVSDIVPTGYSRRYIVLYDSGSEVIRIKYKSKKE